MPRDDSGPCSQRSPVGRLPAGREAHCTLPAGRRAPAPGYQSEARYVADIDLDRCTGWAETAPQGQSSRVRCRRRGPCVTRRPRAQSAGADGTRDLRCAHVCDGRGATPRQSSVLSLGPAGGAWMRRCSGSGGLSPSDGPALLASGRLWP